MIWWAWITIGALFLVAEMLIVDAGFYLVFLGIAALIVGGADLAGWSGPGWLDWIAFGALSAALMIFFRQRLYDKFRGNLPGFEGKLDGETMTVPQGLEPGGTVRIEFRGTTWTACNIGDVAILPQGRAVVDRADGIRLLLRAADR